MKHDWITEEYDPEEIDTSRFESHPYCNGPECARCGYSDCHHCNRGMYEQECLGSVEASS